MGMTPGNPPATGRLIIVSNRLPLSARRQEGGLTMSLSSGGVATGLRAPHEAGQGVWIGWPGELGRLTAEERERLDQLFAEQRIVPVTLSRSEATSFYADFCNGVIWPLFHYMIDRIPEDARGWKAFQAVNERFAATVLEQARPGDRVWIHDYQLALLPGLLRRARPDLRIGFFLHIPFPSAEVFRILPWRREYLEGLLGADLIGFHTFSYLRYFRRALLEILGREAGLTSFLWEERPVRFGVFPMGIDAAAFEQLARDRDVQKEARRLRRHAGDRRLLLGVNRLDYTKGLPRRLLAFRRLLETHPEWHEKVEFIQLAVPSRGQVGEYRRLKTSVEQLVGRINGEFGTPGWTPIRYLHRSIAPRRLVSLYRGADVMLVTPLRDGMNLVAKEFVASRPDNDGVLILSELAGAAIELAEAVRVNPYDVDGIAAAIDRSLRMRRSERGSRMRSLRARVAGSTVHDWARDFLRSLDSSNGETTAPRWRWFPGSGPEVEALRRARPLFLLLDYDGTLVPLAEHPSLAPPDDALLDLLRRLAARPDTRVEILTGRPRQPIEEWLGDLPVGLWAEHGFWHRPAPGEPWRSNRPVEDRWMADLLPVMEEFARRTPGSFVEEKSAGLAWHHRMVDPEFGAHQSIQLRAHLADLVANEPLQVLPGDHVVEVRLAGIHKGLVVAAALNGLDDEAGILAIGDDSTDEDLFAALPERAVTIRVGPGSSVATWRVADPRGVRRLLERLVE